MVILDSLTSGAIWPRLWSMNKKAECAVVTRISRLPQCGATAPRDGPRKINQLGGAGRDAGRAQARDEPLEKSAVVAEKEFLAGERGGVVGLALEQVGRRARGFRPVAEAAEGRRKRRKGAVGDVG